MKKRIIQIICVMLAVITVFCSASVAFAKEKVTPVIVVHGLGGSDLYQHLGTSDEVKIPQFGLDVQAMMKNQTILNEALRLFSKENEPNYEALFKALGDYFEKTNLNYTKDGTPQKGQGVNSYWETPLSKHPDYLTMRDFSIPVIARQIAKNIGKKNVYAFNYDWRDDMCQSAKKLRKMVVAVKKRTGAKKVTIVALSLGGAVTSAYMDAYKSKKDVARYILINPAYMGVDVARAFRFDLKFDKKDMITYLHKMEYDFNAGQRETLFKAVLALGDYRIGCGLDNLNNDIANNPAMRKKFFNMVVKKWIGNIPAFYELIPYKDYNKAIECLTKIGYLDKKSGLYKKISNYHKVQGRFKKNLKYVKKNGAEVAIIANYGTKGLPVTSKKNNHTDLLIDTKYASVGATVAQYGKKLKGKNAKGKYISPDKVINASTCTLPNNTWFLKNVIHGLYIYDADTTKLIANLSTGKVKCNIKAVKKKYGYSQFLKADKEQKLKNIKK